MNWEVLTTSKLVADLGWTLLASLWQISLTAGVLLLVLRLLAARSADLRYAVSVLALAVCVALPVATYLQISGTTATLPEHDRAAEQAALELDGSDAGRSGRSAAAGAADHLASKDQTGGKAFFAGTRRFLDERVPTILPFAVSLWLFGIALFSMRLAGGVWQLRRYRTIDNGPVEPEWQERFRLLRKRLGISRTVGLLRSTLVETPIAIGIFRPLILVPASAFLQISPRELETVIAHELIHIRRFDPLVSMVQSLVETLFFFHPAVWWISNQIRREREFAADTAVLTVFNGSHVVYASALANLEEIRLAANKQMPRIATAANGGNLMQRISRILKIKTEVSGASSAWTAGLAFVLTSAFLLAVFSFNSTGLVNAQGKASNRKVAIGFVSIPPVDRTDNPPKDSDATARLLIAKLNQYKIPAIGFLAGGMVSDGEKLFPVRANIVRLWRDAGFEIGIGGFKHLSFHDTPYDDYVANVEKGERVARQILGEKDLRLRYFSYPYLRTSKSGDDHKRFEAWLAGRGITSIKYGIDNQEWMYSYAYDMARNDNDVNTMKEVREAFIDYMTQMFAHYEAYSREMFGRDIPQTMVLTPSRLVTDSADDLFGMMQKRGYSFITMEDAMSDEVYKGDEHYAGNGGISWFERWRFATGKPLRHEPDIHTDIQKVWNERNPKK